MTSDFNEVKAAVIRYLSSSARKLRNQHSYARRIYVGIETNPFNEYQRQTFRGYQIEFPVPTDNTFEMDPLCPDDPACDLAALCAGRTSLRVQAGNGHPLRPDPGRGCAAQHVPSKARYGTTAAACRRRWTK